MHTNHLPAGFTSPDDLAQTLAKTLLCMGHRPLAVPIAFTEGAFTCIGTDLGSTHPTFFLQLFGAELLQTLIMDNPTTNPRSVMLHALANIYLPLGCGLLGANGEMLDSILPTGYIVWPGIPLIATV